METLLCFYAQRDDELASYENVCRGNIALIKSLSSIGYF